jgi:DNA-binding response OmpR family regulator
MAANRTNRTDASESIARGLDSILEAAGDAVDSARDFLATEEGRKLRQLVATLLIVSAPVLSELPVVRRSRLARVMRTAAVGALLVKGAEWFRDWDPVAPHPAGRRPRG